MSSCIIVLDFTTLESRPLPRKRDNQCPKCYVIISTLFGGRVTRVYSLLGSNFTIPPREFQERIYNISFFV
jgi:hypothetical protein